MLAVKVACSEIGWDARTALRNVTTQMPGLPTQTVALLPRNLAPLASTSTSTDDGKACTHLQSSAGGQSSGSSLVVIRFICSRPTRDETVCAIHVYKDTLIIEQSHTFPLHPRCALAHRLFTVSESQSTGALIA